MPCFQIGLSPKVSQFLSVLHRISSVFFPQQSSRTCETRSSLHCLVLHILVWLKKLKKKIFCQCHALLSSELFIPPFYSNFSSSKLADRTLSLYSRPGVPPVSLQLSLSPVSPVICPVFSFFVGCLLRFCLVLWFSVMLHPALPCWYWS